MVKCTDIHKYFNNFCIPLKALLKLQFCLMTGCAVRAAVVSHEFTRTHLPNSPHHDVICQHGFKPYFDYVSVKTYILQKQTH